MKINLFWFRRDLRLEDNTALYEAARSGLPVMLLFIFDTDIISELPAYDPRITFIYKTLEKINSKLIGYGSSLNVVTGNPLKVFRDLLISFEINAVYANKDYEPYSISRDMQIAGLLAENNISFNLFKDQVIFEEDEIIKPDNKPYTIFTPYKKRWLSQFSANNNKQAEKPKFSDPPFFHHSFIFPAINQIGFKESNIKVRPYDLSVIEEYDKYRDIPFADRTTYLGPHLRFGTISIRKLVSNALIKNKTFLNELIWREFFMQILFNFPDVVSGNFKTRFDNISWRNNEKEFESWCNGETGYPIVDAGMRQLNETGYMHNRVRMITAGFLCKHLLIDWRWGEAWFAGKLLDYELSSNNGNWQWAAGTGCDAVPYFRVFNPELQIKKFDPDYHYIKKWCSNFGTKEYPAPIVNHEFARNRAIEAYKKGIKS